MKKIITIIGLIVTLVGCGSTKETIVVDQQGNIIETKVEDGNRFIKTEWISIQGELHDYTVFIDTKTGCRYITRLQGVSPLYDEYGNVEGCKSINKKEAK